MANDQRRRVWAIPGKLVQDLERGRPHYVGYDLVNDPNELADHEIPGGNRYRVKVDGQLVKDDSYIRGALMDLDRAGIASLSEQPPTLAAKGQKKHAAPAEKVEG